MQPPIRRYIKIALFNLLLVTTIGVVMRYKIAFSLPFIDQKHLMHGHSHFAFAGWISHTLMSLMVAFIARKKGNDVEGNAIYKKYRWVIYANLITAFGMLISLSIFGYNLIAIVFSTLSREIISCIPK